MGMITFTMGVAVFTSMKYRKASELIGLSIMVPTLVIIYMSYLSDFIE